MATGSFIGVGNFKGYWDANANSGSADYLNTGTPLLASSASATAGYNAAVTPAQVASVGDYWQVNVAGTASIDSISTWNLNDWVVYQGDETTSPTTYTWNRLSVTDTIAATVIGNISESGLKNTLLASASAGRTSEPSMERSGMVLFCSSSLGSAGTQKYFEGDAGLKWDPYSNILKVTGSIVVDGTIEATQLHTNFVTSSVIFDDGDTKFGNTADDLHQFTGSIECTLGITSSTNVQAAFFEGDGSRLTGITAGSSLGNSLYGNPSAHRVPFFGDVDGGGKYGLSGSANLNFFTASNDLQVTGNIRATNFYAADKIFHEGDTNTFLHFTDDSAALSTGGIRGFEQNTTSIEFNPDSENFSVSLRGAVNPHVFFSTSTSNNVGIRCAPSGSDQALTVSGSTLFGSASANSHEFIGSIYAEQDIVHLGDTDTKITFTNDQIDFTAGGTTLLTLDEDAQNLVQIGDGTDVDLKVRGLNDDFAIFVQGSSDKVGIGTSNPLQKLSVSGSTVFGTAGGTDSHWFTGSIYVSDDIHVQDKIYGLNDLNTYIDFSTDDQLALQAGGVTMVQLVEGASTDYLRLGGAASLDIDIRMGANGNDDSLWVDGLSNNVGIRCSPSGSDQALTVSGSTLFGSASANTHEFTGSIMTDSSIYFGNRLINWNDDDTYIQFDDDSMSFVVGNATFISLSETANDVITFNGTGADIDFLVKSNGATGAGAATSLTHTVFVEGSSARVGIAESAPGAQLDVSGSTILGRHDGDTVSYHQVSGTLEVTGNLGVNTPATTYSLTLPNTDSLVGRGMAYAWSTYSSARYKENVFTMNDPIETAKKLRGVEFTWKESGHKDFGFIAEEVGKVLPQIVAYEDDGHTATGMDYSKITSLLVECVKTQQAQLETQEKRIKTLEKKLKS
jgi:hypothetical protein